MQQNLVSFVILRFLRPTSSHAIHLFLIDCGDGNALRVWVHPDWKRWADAEDQLFLSDLMEEWRKTVGPERTAVLFEELKRQAWGPLMVRKYGRVSAEESQAMIAELLSGKLPEGETES